MAWIYLLIASLLEIAWTFSLKFMDVKKIKAIYWPGIFSKKENWMILTPFAGYILFGVGNILFFSMAMKQIPASTALAVWMGVTLIGVKMVDTGVFKEPYNWQQFFYMGLILIGIVGLKRNP
ncbi:MAG TPA: SMR family transporter [Puia sp.]|nr:SMR family transporter [Puia sp.]